MSYADYDAKPERGKPRPPVTYGEQHRLVLRVTDAGAVKADAEYEAARQMTLDVERVA